MRELAAARTARETKSSPRKKRRSEVADSTSAFIVPAWVGAVCRGLAPTTNETRGTASGFKRCPYFRDRRRFIAWQGVVGQVRTGTTAIRPTIPIAFFVKIRSAMLRSIWLAGLPGELASSQTAPLHPDRCPGCPRNLPRCGTWLEKHLPFRRYCGRPRPCPPLLHRRPATIPAAEAVPAGCNSQRRLEP